MLWVIGLWLSGCLSVGKKQSWQVFTGDQNKGGVWRWKWINFTRRLFRKGKQRHKLSHWPHPFFLFNSCICNSSLTNNITLQLLTHNSTWASALFNRRFYAHLPACLPACLPVCLPAYLSACLPTCLSVFHWSLVWDLISIALLWRLSQSTRSESVQCMKRQRYPSHWMCFVYRSVSGYHWQSGSASSQRLCRWLLGIAFKHFAQGN